MAHNVSVPRSMRDVLRILNCESDDPWVRIGAVLAWAARQPDAAEKMPAEWHEEMERDDYHPGTDAFDEAIRAGRVLRDIKFIPMPGSKWDTAST